MEVPKEIVKNHGVLKHHYTVIRYAHSTRQFVWILGMHVGEIIITRSSTKMGFVFPWESHGRLGKMHRFSMTCALKNKNFPPTDNLLENIF